MLLHLMLSAFNVQLWGYANDKDLSVLYLPSLSSFLPRTPFLDVLSAPDYIVAKFALAAILRAVNVLFWGW